MTTIDDVLTGRAKWTVITGDCLDVLRTIPAGSVDAVVTDPPYGLGDRMTTGDSGEWSKGWKQSPSWDGSVATLPEIATDGRPSIIWGGNYYSLPPRRGWLIWDKMQEHTSGHAELAWTTIDQPVRTYRLSRVEAYSTMGKQHPTQKPVGLMTWCLSFVPENALVLDPFCGSGTTGVACMQTGRRFIGIEIDEGYAAIARRRIAEAANHLFQEQTQ